jgi:hypothetical protein
MQAFLKFIAGFLRESNGDSSSQRLIYITGSLYAMALGAAVFGVTKDYVAAIAVVTSLSAVFGGQKLIQKSQESKSE